MVAIRPGLESIPSATLEVRWTHAEPVSVEVRRYRIEWPGGALELEPRDMVVPPGTALHRTVRVDRGRLPDDPATVRFTVLRARRR